VPFSQNANSMQQPLLQLKQQQDGMSAVVDNEATVAPNAQEQQPRCEQRHVVVRKDTMVEQTSCCVHLCMQE
jgi:hypothetical protein